ncbi:MAG TPA: hypothetical protein VI968_03180 [archaeon]|nr:hypothetical protein [archaeon]
MHIPHAEAFSQELRKRAYSNLRCVLLAKKQSNGSLTEKYAIWEGNEMLGVYTAKRNSGKLEAMSYEGYINELGHVFLDARSCECENRTGMHRHDSHRIKFAEEEHFPGDVVPASRYL